MMRKLEALSSCREPPADTPNWWNGSLWAHVVYVIWYQAHFARWRGRDGTMAARRTITDVLAP